MKINRPNRHQGTCALYVLSPYYPHEDDDDRAGGDGWRHDVGPRTVRRASDFAGAWPEWVERDGFGPIGVGPVGRPRQPGLGGLRNPVPRGSVCPGIARGAATRAHQAYGGNRAVQCSMGCNHGHHRAGRRVSRAIKKPGSDTTPNARRTRPMVTITLSPKAISMLDDAANCLGMSRSAAVEWMIRDHCAMTTPASNPRRRAGG